MELIPTIDALNWCADAGPKILADEKIRYSQAFLLTKRSHFAYEPIGVVGVIAPWNYPWSIPFGEVAIALMAGNGVVLKPASLTPLIGERIQRDLREGRLPRGARPHRPRRRRGRRRAGEVERREDLLHRLGRGRAQGRRGLRAAAEGLRPRARRQGPDDRLRRRQPRPRDRRRPLGRVRERRPDLLGDRAGLRRARGRASRSSTASSAARRRCGSATRWPGTTEIGPMTSEEQYELVIELVDDAVAAGAEKLCGGPIEVDGFSGNSSPRPC